MSKKLNKLVDINGLREFKNKLVGTDSAYVQTTAVDQTIAGTKTFSKPIAGSVTGSSGSCTGNSATATKLATARSLWGNNFDGSAAITGTIIGTPGIEFKPVATTANNGGVLDFHYNQSTADHTSRIIESASGTLSINNVTITTGKVVTATTFNGALKGNVTGNCSGSSGSCTGNAASANIATKATQDAAGNTITTTYVTKTEASKTYVTKTDAAKTYATKSEIIVQTGVIIPFAGTSVPTGYLLCNGAAVSRTNYANLFAAIGTRYGAGNGSTTFNLPDARDRVLQGASGTHSAGSYIAAGLPNITGHIYQGITCAAIQAGDGAFYGSESTSYAQPSQYGAFPRTVNFDASRASRIYGASSTVQSPAIATNFIIKY